MIEITVDRVFETAERIVAGKEDYVYINMHGDSPAPGSSVDCFYVHHDSPGCIVGSILHEMGVGLGAMFPHEGSDARQLLMHLEANGVAEVDDLAIIALQQMQSNQDSGKTWGESVWETNRTMPID